MCKDIFAEGDLSLGGNGKCAHGWLIFLGQCKAINTLQSSARVGQNLRHGHTPSRMITVGPRLRQRPIPAKSSGSLGPHIDLELLADPCA